MSIKHGHARWAFDLKAWTPSLADLRLSTSCIQSEERTRLGKFLFREDFNASLIGRLMMRAFIKKCNPQLDYNKIIFERDKWGKPYLRQREDGADKQSSTDHKLRIAFNVSHHDSYVVLAGFTANDDTVSIIDHVPNEAIDTMPSIGVDIMKMEYTGGKSLNEFFNVMNRTFSEEEWHYIRSRNGEISQTEAFMRTWCLKEAFTKNLGVGVLSNLRRISFRINTDCLSKSAHVRDTTVTTYIESSHNWLFEESLIDDEHCVAVAIKNPTSDYLQAEHILFEIINFEKLMEHAIPLMPVDLDYCQNILAKEYKKK